MCLSTFSVTHPNVLDVSQLQHNWFKWTGKYQGSATKEQLCQPYLAYRSQTEQLVRDPSLKDIFVMLMPPRLSDLVVPVFNAHKTAYVCRGLTETQTCCLLAESLSLIYRSRISLQEERGDIFANVLKWESHINILTPSIYTLEFCAWTSFWEQLLQQKVGCGWDSIAKLLLLWAMNWLEMDHLQYLLL